MTKRLAKYIQPTIDDVLGGGLTQALLAEDELGVVIRTHILIESELGQFIDLLLVEPKHLREGARLSFDVKLRLALALGLPAKFQGPLTSLGAIRNKFAHEPNRKLTKDDVERIFSSLDKSDKTTVQHSYQRMNERVGRSEFKGAYKEQTPKDQFTVMAINMRAALVATRYQFAKELFEE